MQHFPLTSSFGVKVVQQLRNRLQAQGSFCTRFSGGNAIEAAAAAAVEESAASTHAAASALKSTSDGWDRETQMLALKVRCWSAVSYRSAVSYWSAVSYCQLSAIGQLSVLEANSKGFWSNIGVKRKGVRIRSAVCVERKGLFS